MRRIVHRLLTGFPMLVVAILALLAAADPTQAKVYLYRIIDLMSDERFFWLCIVVVVSYFVLWWVTSLEPRSRRQKLQERLRTYHHQLTDAEARIKTASSDADFLAASDKTTELLPPICQWIIDNMGNAAFTKFNNASVEWAGDWSWPSNKGSALAKQRSNTINFVHARIQILDIFLQSDGWDGVPTSKWALAKRKFKQWRLKRKDA